MIGSLMFDNTNFKMLSSFIDDYEPNSARRMRQIDTLKVFNDKVTTLSEDGEYRVDFACGLREMCMLVSLPPEFPRVKPLLRVQPQVRHPWVNEMTGEVTNAPGLLNFSMHSDLGRVVAAVIRELELRPPPLAEAPAPALKLDTLSNTELQKLNDSADLRERHVAALLEQLEREQAVAQLMKSTEELAESNLSLEPRLQELQVSVAERQQRLASQRRSYEAASDRFQRLAASYSPQSICEALRTAARGCDERSERIAEEFLSKEVPVETFLERYVDARMLSHLRKTKEEKLSFQLIELQRAGY